MNSAHESKLACKCALLLRQPHWHSSYYYLSSICRHSTVTVLPPDDYLQLHQADFKLQALQRLAGILFSQSVIQNQVTRITVTVTATLACSGSELSESVPGLEVRCWFWLIDGQHSGTVQSLTKTDFKILLYKPQTMGSVPCLNALIDIMNKQAQIHYKVIPDNRNTKSLQEVIYTWIES